jgi:hypothetical protein
MSNRGDLARMSLRATLRVGALVVLAGLALSACRKKTAPEYYQLESNASILADRDGDDAWAGDEMSSVLTSLRAIDPEAVEGPKAQALISKIEAQRARVAKDKAEAAAAITNVAPRVTVRLFDDPKNAAAAAAAPTPDASVPDRPWGGMAVADFQKRFGSCMTAEGEKQVPGLGAAMVFAVKNDVPSCRKTYGLPDDGSVRQTYVFRNEQLAAQHTEQRTRTVLDAGPGEYLLVDAGEEPRLTVIPQIRDVGGADAGS